MFLCGLLWIFCSFSFAQNDSLPRKKYLQITTNPIGADVYINTASPNHASNPDFRLPGYIQVPEGESSILVSLFRPEFADTAINIHLSEKDTSYLIVALRPNYDENATQEQYAELSHRYRRNIGHNLLITSAVPLAIGGIAAIVANYKIGKANDIKEKIEASLIHEGDRYNGLNRDFKDNRESAQEARNIVKLGLILGGAIFSVGLILSF